MRRLLASGAILGFAAVLAHGQGAGLKVEGNWALTGAISKGMKLPDALFAKFMGKMVVKGDAYEQSQMGATLEKGKFKIDASKKPAALDLEILSGDDKGKTQLGIIKLEGDTLTVAVGKAGGGPRPKNFDGGEDIEVTIFKRSK